MTNETVQLFSQLNTEIQELKKQLSHLSKKDQSSAPQQEKQFKNKPTNVKSTKLPTYIITLDSIKVTSPKRKLTATSSPKDINAAKIQSLIRGALVRKRLTKYRFQQYCIKKIQACIRGFLVRKRQEKIAKRKVSLTNECEKCKQHELEISALKSQISELKLIVEDCQKTKLQHEKALKYLFSQLKSITPQPEKAKIQHEETKEKSEEKIIHESKNEEIPPQNSKSKIVYFK